MIDTDFDKELVEIEFACYVMFAREVGSQNKSVNQKIYSELQRMISQIVTCRFNENADEVSKHGLLNSLILLYRE